jgi:SWI/SNF-related matrix-associated actin-dependent regulator of chromatin subfamily A-like protein 1
MGANFTRPLTPTQRELLEMSRAIETKFEVPSPAGKSYLPFQLAGIEYGVHPAVKNVLLGDEPGLGKTVQAIGICNKLKAQNILIVCPAKLRGVWRTHVQDWLTYEGAQVEIVSYNYLADPENVKSLMKKGPFDVGVFDEVHYLKNATAKRTKYTLAKNGLVSVIKKSICISGTPIQNRPMDLYPIAKTMAPLSIEGMDKFGFGIRYCEGWKTPWGSWDFSGASNVKELGLRMRANFMVRRTKEKVLKDLPEKFVNLVHVESKGGALAMAHLETLDVETVIKGGGKLDGDVHISTARQQVGVTKIAFALDYICEQLESGHKKIVVFAHHKEVIDGLANGFDARGVRFVCMRGGMNDAQAKAVVDSFQMDGETQVFIGSLMASKEGITLTAASYVVFVEFSWAPMDNEQAMDRTHRIGQKNNVMVDFLVHKGSLDERIAKFNIQKSKAIKEFGE